MDEQQQSRWRIAGKWALRASCVILALALVISLYGGYRYGWEWVGLVKNTEFPKRTLWDWLKLLIIPAAIAGGTIWFNWHRQALEEQQAIHSETVKALQDEKESVAYVAVQVREEGLPDDDKKRRAQLLMALYLAMLFQKSDRSRALVFSALRDSYQGKHQEEHKEILNRLKVDLERYSGDLEAAQKGLVEGAFTIDVHRYIAKLEVLEKAFEKSLHEQKELDLVLQETGEPPMEHQE